MAPTERRIAHWISVSPGQHFGAACFTLTVVVAVGFGRGVGIHVHGASFRASAIAALAVLEGVALTTASGLVIVIVPGFAGGIGFGAGVLVAYAVTAITGEMNATNAATNTHPLTRGRSSSASGDASTGANSSGSTAALEACLVMPNGRRREPDGL